MNYHIDENLTFKHYKEPLRKIPKSKGFGFYGAILMTKDMDKIQCHKCGEVHRTLAGHLFRKHKMTAEQYKEEFQLARTTALISESMRFELKRKSIDWLKSLTKEEKLELKHKRQEAIRNSKYNHVQPKIRLETKNKRGTCPDQLIDQIVKCAKAMGRTPTKPEFIEWAGTQRYVHLIYKTFGSWREAIRLSGLKEHIPVSFNGFDDEQLLDLLRSYYKQYGIPPTTSDFSRGLLPSVDTYRTHFGGITKARELAGIPHPDVRAIYSDEEVIQKIQTWTQKHGREPRWHEFSPKNDLPSRALCEKRFGGIGKAREMAGLTKSFSGENLRKKYD